jgi:hypothetical protein
VSNKRRKSIGQKKLRRNLLIRIARGGGNMPGDGSWRDEYLTAVENIIDDKPVMVGRYSGVVLKDHAQIVRETEQLRAEVDELVMPYWRGASA